ncbi:MAG: LysM peptidoglycan-binding domain-containing protein [Methyloligellaceae bacterium]
MHRNQHDASVFGVLGLAAIALVSFSLAGCSDKDETAEKKKQAEQQLSQQPTLRTPGGRSVTPTPVPPRKGVAVPSFDVVRIDKSGDGVIAGRAEPGWKVVIEAGGRNLATVTTDRDGEWAAVLDKPLAPGDHTLGLKAYAPDGTRGLVSDQTVVVAVAGQRSEETVVALSTPGRPTKVIRPQQTAPSARTRPQAEAPPRNVVRSEPLTASERASATANNRPATAPQVGSTETRVADARTAGAPVSSDRGVAGRAPAQASVAQPASPDAGAAPIGNAGSTESGVAGLIPGGEAGRLATQTGSDKVAALQRRTAAGAAPVGPIARSGAETNRGAEGALATVSPRPSITPTKRDATGAGSIKTRKFSAAPLADATGTADTARAGVGRTGATKAPQPKADPSVAFETVDYEHASPGKSRVFISGSAKAGARLFIYIDNEPVGEARAKEDGRWVFSGPITLRSGAHQMRADQVTGGGDVVARAEVTFERLTTTALAAPAAKGAAADTPAPTASPQPAAEPSAAGDEAPTTSVALAAPGAAQPAAEPKSRATAQRARKPVRKRRSKRRSRRSRSMVVVRRGDSLWRISRRVYGRGARYTTIYRRNKHQIRDPNLIYPRQRLRMTGR